MDGERPELVEGEAAGELRQHLFDAIELLVALGVVGLLPGLGLLEPDLVAEKDLAQALSADLDRPVLSDQISQPAPMPG